MRHANDDSLLRGRPGADETAVVAALRADDYTAAWLLDTAEEELAVWAGGVACVAVSSPAAALHVAYAAVGLGRGDEVITSPLASVAAATTAAVQGARVVFADIDDETANLDAAALGAALTARTRVVTATDQAGHPGEYDDLRTLTDPTDAVLVADAGGAFGAAYKGVPIGAIADLTAFSFDALDLAGGVVAVADESRLTAARQFRGPDTVVHRIGLDYQLPAVLCALTRVRLRRLSVVTARRTELAERYGKLLDDVAGIRLPVRRAWVEPAWQRYPVRILDGRRSEVHNGLMAAGVEVAPADIPVYWHPAFADLGYRRGLCPTAERVQSERLCLPLTPDLTDDDQDHIVDALRTALR